jgi:hypothetical protein
MDTIDNKCPACGKTAQDSQIDLIDVNALTEEEFYADKAANSQTRLDICKSCPELVGPLNNCTQCGCFMNIKVRIYSASCPLGKW